MKYLIRILIIVVATVPFFVHAQLPSLIVCDPVPTQSGGATGDCTFNSLLGLANAIIKFFIVIGASVFAIMFMYAGYLYLTAVGNSGQISKAHSIFLDAIIGFIIMLAAWLLVDFILTSLNIPTKYRLLGK